MSRGVADDPPYRSETVRSSRISVGVSSRRRQPRTVQRLTLVCANLAHTDDTSSCWRNSRTLVRPVDGHTVIDLARRRESVQNCRRRHDKQRIRGPCLRHTVDNQTEVIDPGGPHERDRRTLFGIDVRPSTDAHYKTVAIERDEHRRDVRRTFAGRRDEKRAGAEPRHLDPQVSQLDGDTHRASLRADSRVTLKLIRGSKKSVSSNKCEPGSMERHSLSPQRIAILGLCMFAATFAVSCSSSGHSVGSPTSTTVTAAPTTASTSSKGSTSSTVPASQVKRAPNCKFSQLAVTATGDSATGHIGVLVRFENTRASTCDLIGYPGVAGLDAAGRQVVQAARTLHGFIPGVPTGQRPPVVVLADGQSASAFVEGTDVPQGNDHPCPTYPRLLVRPPNTMHSVRIDMAMPGCSPLQVHPVVPGTSGSLNG